MSITILVTGSTGTIGTQVIKQLTAHPGVKVRAAVRSTAKADAVRGLGAEPVEFEWSRPETFNAALQGADKLFLLTPFTPDQVELAQRLIDAAKAAGIKHIVKISAFGCDNEPGIQLGRWHRAVEQAVESSGIPYTFLRPNNFMENFIGYYPPAPDGNIYLPFGQGAVSWIDGRDVAAVAVAALLGHGHEGKAYTLTGGEALTVEQVAAQIAEASGRTVRFVDVPEEAARSAMLGMQLPEWMVNAMMELHGIDKAGYAAAVTPTVQEITGSAPRTFQDFARENAAAWQPRAAT
jgi:uncharacterized protein YbjT (DUF2867 family)